MPRIPSPELGGEPLRSDDIERLRVLEGTTGASLPTEVVSSLASSQVSDKDLVRYAKQIARRTSVPLQTWFMRVPQLRTDDSPHPLFYDKAAGKVVTLEDARRLYKVYKRESIEYLFPQLGADPRRVAMVFKAMGKMRGREAAFAPLLTMARDIANSKLNLYRLQDNLKVLSEAQGLFPGTGSDAFQALALAKRATEAGVVFRDSGDVMAFINPDVAGSVEAQRAARERLENDPAYEQIRRYGDPSSPDYQPDSDFARTWQTLTARGPLYASSLYGGDSVFSALLAAIGNDEDDYIKAGEALVAQLQAAENSDSVLQNLRDPGTILDAARQAPFALPATLFGFVVGWLSFGAVKLLNGLDRSWQTVERIAWEPFLALPGEESRKDNDRAWDMAKDIADIWHGRATAEEELTEEGLPGWLYWTVGIVASFFVAPELLIGKAVRARSLARLFPTARSVERWQFTARVLYYDRHRLGRGFGTTTLPEAFVRAASESEDAAAMTLRVNSLLSRNFGTKGAHPQVLRTIFEYVREAKSAGRTADDLVNDVREVLMMAHGVQPGTGNSLARRVMADFEKARASAAADLPELARTLEASEDALVRQAERATKVLEDYEGLIGSVGVLDAEVPTVANAAIRLGRRMAASKALDSEWGRGVRALVVRAPRKTANEFRIMLDASDLPDQITAVAKRSRLFSNDEVARLQMDTAKFMDRALPMREREFQKFLKRMETTMLKRMAKRAGAEDWQTEQIVKMIEDRLKPRYGASASFQGTTEGIFGVLPGKGALAGRATITFDQPIASSQLRNEFSVLDPLLVRQGFNSAMGYYRQVRNSIKRSIGKEIPALTTGIPGINLTSELIGRTSRKVWEDLFSLVMRDLFLTWWKPFVVIRPAYILRVVGIEEQSRFIATRGVVERLRSQRGLERLVRPSEMRYGKRGIVVPLQLPEGATLEEAQRVFADVSGAEIRAVDAAAGKFEVYRPITNAVEVGEAAIADNTMTAMVLAGDKSPLADVLMRASAPKYDKLFMPFDDISTLRRAAARGQKGSRSALKKLDRVTAGWAHALNYQFAGDPVGGMILRDIAQGVDRDTSARLITDAIMQSKADKGDLWERVASLLDDANAERGEVEGAVERLMMAVDEYTLDRSQEFAGLVRDGGVSPSGLRNMALEESFDVGLLPTAIHGAELELLMAADSLPKRAMRRYSSAILRVPTNRLSRRPYARSWMNAYQEATYALFEASGRTLTPELKNVIVKQSEAFAKTQVDRIMFDYTRQGRFAEALDWMFPFLGPYTEQYLVWGRILKQNPAVIGYVRQAYRAGKESGFLREDENGDLQIPLSGWLGASSVFNAVYGQPGWQLSAPLANMNFFLQTSLPVRLHDRQGGSIELDIPFPGVGVNIQFVIQQFLNSEFASNVDPEVLATLTGYAMRYGPVALESLLPPYVRNFIAGAFGLAGVPVLQEDTRNRYVSGMLRNYAMQTFRLKDGRTVGLTAENLAAYPEFAQAVADRTFDGIKEANAWLADKAEGDVAKMFLMRSFMVAFFPAAPMIEGPAAAWEAELRKLREDPAFADDYTALQDEWLRRHPDGMVFLISKTMSDDLQSGAYQPIPSNEVAMRLLQGKGAREFALAYPGLVWAIIPRELRERSDVATFFANLASGLLQTRPATDPENATGTLELVAIRQGWREFYAIKDAWEAYKATNPGWDSDDPTTAEADIYSGPIAALRARNELWAKDYDTWEAQGIDWRVIDQARVVAEDPLFRQTELGQALGEFLPLLDRVRGAMADNAISNITDKGAEVMGLRKEWEEGLASLQERFPDFDLWVSLYQIDEALTKVDSSTETYLAALPDAERSRIEASWKEYEGIIGLPGDTLDVDERTAAYNDRAPLVNSWYGEYPEGKTPIHLWWGNISPLEKTRYLQTWSQYPVQWLDRFQKEQLGIPSDDATEQTLASYNQAVAQIEARYDAGGSREDRSAAYDSINAQLRRLEAQNPVLRQQVAISNTWAYGFFAANPTLLDPANSAAEEWNALAQSSMTIMRYVYAVDGYGTDDYDDRQRGWYNEMFKALGTYVQTELFENHAFQTQWEQYVNAYGGVDLLRQFMPEFAGRFGSGAYLSEWP